LRIVEHFVIRQSQANVEAESLYEAAVLDIRRLNEDPWLEKIDPAMERLVPDRDEHAIPTGDAGSSERLSATAARAQVGSGTP
jgi:hypothetical protein